MTTKIKSTSLEDNAVTTAKIASDAVTAAKIPANAIGNSELDLIASYAFSGTISGAGSVERISTGSAGSGVSSIEIDIPTDASYNHFVLNIHDLYGSGDGDLRMEIRKQSGSAYQTNYTYSTMERTYGASPSGASGNSGSGTLEMTYYNLGNAIAVANSYNLIITNNISFIYLIDKLIKTLLKIYYFLFINYHLKYIIILFNKSIYFIYYFIPYILSNTY